MSLAGKEICKNFPSSPLLKDSVLDSNSNFFHSLLICEEAKENKKEIVEGECVLILLRSKVNPLGVDSLPSFSNDLVRSYLVIAPPYPYMNFVLLDLRDWQELG